MVRRTKTESKPQDLLEAAIEAELVKRDRTALVSDFKAFVKAAWPHVENFPFKEGVHVDAICEHMQAAGERRIKSLVINVPPRLGKSTLCSVLFPAWILARNAKETLLHASYSAPLAVRDSVKTRTLIESDWFRARWPEVSLREDQNLKSSFQTTVGGGRMTTSVGGTVTGLGGTFLILDDPLNAQDGDSATVREAANQWFAEAWYNRINGDPDQAVRIVIMQRLHARDVSALCIDSGWDHLNLPMEFEGEIKPTSIGWHDPRTEFGQLLWPDQWNTEAVAKLKKALGPMAYAGQYQQNPVPRGGGTIKRVWLRFWYDPARLGGPPDPVTAQLEDGTFIELPQKAWAPPKGATYVNSWDVAFKGGPKSDFVVGQAWLTEAGNAYLVDQERGRWDFVETKAAVKRLHSRCRGLPTLVEAKANGDAVMTALREEDNFIGLLPVDPKGDKFSRLSAVAPLFAAGTVWLPHPAMAPWVGSEYIPEITTAPRGLNDDQADASSQALAHISASPETLVDFGHDALDGDASEMLIEPSYWLD